MFGLQDSSCAREVLSLVQSDPRSIVFIERVGGGAVEDVLAEIAMAES